MWSVVVFRVIQGQILPIRSPLSQVDLPFLTSRHLRRLPDYQFPASPCEGQGLVCGG